MRTSPLQLFPTALALLATKENKAENVLGDAALLAISDNGIMFVDENAEFDGEVDLPANTRFIARFANNQLGFQVMDQDGRAFGGEELISQLVENLPQNTDGKVNTMAWLSTKSDFNIVTLFVGSAARPRIRIATLRRVGNVIKFKLA